MSADAISSGEEMVSRSSLLAELARVRARARTTLVHARRPFVTLSYAQSLDGSIAAAPGQRSTLSGPESLRLTHGLRAMHDAILVGIGTVLADDPQLTVRLVRGRSPQPVVVDTRLRTPLESRLLHGAGPHRPWIAVSREADEGQRAAVEALGARVFELPTWTNGWVDLPALLRRLSNEGIAHVMVEGGAKIITSFLRARLVDYAVITVVPRFLGGLSALDRIEPGALPRLDTWANERHGGDLVLHGALAWPEAAE